MPVFQSLFQSFQYRLLKKVMKILKSQFKDRL